MTTSGHVSHSREEARLVAPTGGAFRKLVKGFTTQLQRFVIFSVSIFVDTEASAQGSRTLRLAGLLTRVVCTGIPAGNQFRTESEPELLISVPLK